MSAKSTAAGAMDSNGPGSNVLKALVVEDNAVNQKLILRLLEKNGYQAAVVENGRLAVERLAVEVFDFVLMDIQMPEMTGVEATIEIRKKEAESGGHIPIVAVTANAMKGDRERFLAAGMDDYVSKPINTKKLFDIVSRLTAGLRCRESEKGDSEEKVDAAPAGKLDLQLDSVEVLERFDDDVEFLQEVVDQFVADAPSQLAALREAIAGQDAKLLERAAHSLRGAISNFGAEVVVELSGQIESLAIDGGFEDAKALVERLAIGIEQLEKELRTLCATAPQA